VGPRTSQDTLQTRKILFLQKIKPQFLNCPTKSLGARGGAVVKALRYKPEGRGIDSQWRQNFSLT
jgi:hypothetical protein